MLLFFAKKNVLQNQLNSVTYVVNEPLVEVNIHMCLEPAEEVIRAINYGGEVGLF